MTEPIPVAEAHAIEEPFSPSPEPAYPSPPHHQAPPTCLQDEDNNYKDADVSAEEEANVSTPSRSDGGKKGFGILLALIIAGVVALGSGLGVGLSIANKRNEDNDKGGIEVGSTPSPVAENPASLPTVAPVALSRSVVPSVQPTLRPSFLSTPTPSQTPSVFATSSVPSNAPTTENNVLCTELVNTYILCRDTKLNVFEREACTECIREYFNITGTQLCTFWTTEFCTTFPTDDCKCGECVDSLYSYMSQCYIDNPGCLADCSTLTSPPPSPAPTSPAPSIAPSAATAPVDTPCSALTTTYQQCLNRLTDAQTQECVDCANEVIRTVPRNTCGGYVDGMCRGFNQCNCGWCTDEILEWADCAVDGDQCTIDCSIVDLDDVSDAPSSVPTLAGRGDDWVKAAADQSCSSACGSQTCNVAGMQAVDTAEKIEFVAGLLGETCSSTRVDQGTIPPYYQHTDGFCGFTRQGNNVRCEFSLATLHLFCCCGSNCPVE